MSFYWLVLGVLAVSRLAHLIHAEDGPADLIVRLRARAGNSAIGAAMDCFLCLSLWVAIPFALLIGVSWGERALLWLALSAGAILLERVSERRDREA